MRTEPPLAVDVPSPERDKPGWVKVGVIAAVGFVIGIAWPRLVGVRLGPSAPSESAQAGSASASASGAVASAASIARAPDAPPASVAAKTHAPEAPVSASAAANAPPAAPAAAKVLVGKGVVLNCKTVDGEKKTGSKECGRVPAVDALVSPRIRQVATCAGASGQSGKFTVVATADFDKGRITYRLSKSATNVPDAEALNGCLKTSFQDAKLASGAPHEHPRYTISYAATLASEAPAAAPPAPAAAKDEPDAKNAKIASSEEQAAAAPVRPATPSAAGEAAVAWEVALVRDAPKVGTIVARLPRGTKVKLGPTKDGWYQVKFGDDFGTEGWVYRGAVGR